MRKALSVLSFMAAQALVWSLVMTASLMALFWFLSDDTPDLPELWFQMLIGGFAVAAANQAWWRLKKQSFLGWAE